LRGNFKEATGRYATGVGLKSDLWADRRRRPWAPENGKLGRTGVP